MKDRKRITEEDLKVTERRISESWRGLKGAAMKAPGKAAEVAIGRMKEHPLITLALVAGAGMAGFGILKWVLSCSRGGKKRESGSKVWDMALGLLPLALPHIIGLLKEFTGGDGHRGR